MAKRERRQQQQRRGTPAATRERTPPRYGQALVAAAGLVLTGVLLWSGATREALPYCAANSGCDIVQGSAWSRFWGLPLALWGAGAYAALGVLACGRRRWAATALFATSGFGLSLYLTVVGLVVLDAWCVYCLASLALMTAAFVLAVRARPAQGAGRGFALGGSVAVVLALAMHADAYDWPGGSRVDPLLLELARHLETSGARFYGASWCPACQAQKAAFGGAASALPFVECSPHGPRAPRATVCELADIRNYPTWIIGERKVERQLTPEQLARLTGFDGWSRP